MGNDLLDPETALQLFQLVLYCMAYIFGGAALIALSVYVVVVGSEMLFEPPPKPKRVKVLQSAHRVRLAEKTLDPFAAAKPILSLPNTLDEAGVPIDTVSLLTQIPITARAALEAEPSGS